MATHELNLHQWPVDRVIEYARNPRVNDHAVDQMAAVIAEFGFRIPCVVRSDGHLVDGHLRLKAARKLGLHSIPVVLADELTDAQIKAFRLLANRSTTWADWDDELLALEMVELQQAGFDLNLTGFEGVEVTALLDKLVNDGDSEGDDSIADAAMADDIPASAPSTVSLSGDLWLIRQGDLEHRVLCADAGDVAALRALFSGAGAQGVAASRACLCFTSPPYANQRNYTGPGANEDAGQWDRMMQSVCTAMPAVLSPDAPVLINLGLVHRDNEFQPYWDNWLAWMRSNGWRRFGWYVWDQGPGLPGDWNGRLAPAFEFIFHFNRQGASIRRPNKNVDCLYAGRDTHLRGDGTSAGGMRNKDGSKTGWNHVGQVTQDTKIADSVLRIMRHKGKIGQDIDHPAVFPVALPQFVIECYSQPGEIVYEPFCGSGTSLLAAQRSGRRCFAVEIAPSYVDVTLKRFAQNYPEAQIVLASTAQSFAQVSAERVPKTQADAAIDELSDEVAA